MALPRGTTGSLGPTFVLVRLVGLTIKLPSALALYRRLLYALREPLDASVTVWEATAPVKLPAWHCPPAGLRPVVRVTAPKGWYFTVASPRPTSRGSKAPTYPTHSEP